MWVSEYQSMHEYGIPVVNPDLFNKNMLAVFFLFHPAENICKYI